MQNVARWHRESYDRLLNERLPQLLAERLPLADYAAEPAGEGRYRIAVALDAESPLTLTFEVPACDDHGLFEIDGRECVVVPLASCEELDAAEIKCVGEQLYDFIGERLGQAPADMKLDEATARTWLPLDELFGEFLSIGSGPPGWDTVQPLEQGNWLRETEHLRRFVVAVRPGQQKIVAPGQLGRVCPVMTPEGTNVGRILFVARGAEIRDGKLIVTDDSPPAALSLTASMIPFLEHDDPNRALMGANMMRQWVVPPEPEPALIHTGNEPDEPDFWCGRNLLTAFISWGGDTFEDGIVVSESAAARLDFPHALEPGDKLSNRHGTKGVVSRILPDDEMPHLPDGTPAELLFSFMGCHTRLNFGQIREAVAGRIARATGEPMIVAPFGAPDADEFRRRLREAGMDESGMVTLTDGHGGKRLSRPSTVGWVYWGKTHHLAADKIHASVGTQRCNRQGEFEYYAMRNLGAFATIAETFNLRSVDRPEAETLADQVAAGTVPEAEPPAPKFADLVRRLRVAGIQAELKDQKLRFRLAPPKGESLKLACPVQHPWLSGREIDEIGRCAELTDDPRLLQANEKMHRLLAGKGPASLSDAARARLQQAVGESFDALLGWEHLHFGNRVLFSGRTVIAPGPEMRHDQLGLPDEIAWTLFGPLVARRLGGEKDVQARTTRAAEALDETMAGSWVILHRAPSLLVMDAAPVLSPTASLAFRPVRIPGRVIRIPLLACRPMNADFDGDQAAAFIPITPAGQDEAGAKLTLADHLHREARLLDWMAPAMEGVWGLAELSGTPKGLAEIREIAGVDVEAPEGFVTRPTLMKAMRTLLEQAGPEKTLETMEALMARGLEVARASGASLSPFPKTGADLPDLPDGDDLDECEAYEELAAERIASRTDFDNEALGPQLQAVRTHARGNIRQLRTLLAAARVADLHHRIVFVPHSLADGLTGDEYYTRCVGARRGLGEMALMIASGGLEARREHAPKAFTALARAMRSDHPGFVFASAAAIGEVDPLTDLDSRLFVGLEP